LRPSYYGTHTGSRRLQTTPVLHGKIAVAGMTSDSASVTPGLPPKVTLKFTKE
jgi:hypothetical protein